MPISPEARTSILCFCDKVILTAADDHLMTDEHKQLLSDNRKELVGNMIPDDVLNELVSKKVLSNNEVMSIKKKGIINAMNEHLLDFLGYKPDRAFKEFVNALRGTNQRHVANLLVKRGETVVTWVELTSINSNLFPIHVYLPRIDTQ